MHLTCGNQMTRIHITGNAGSGKTTLAARIGASLNLPVFGLDDIVWLPGWEKTPLVEREIRLHSLVLRQSWVIEGVSNTVRQAADIVIFLDVSRPRAYYRCAMRNWRYLFRSRPGLPPNCPEFLIIPRLCRLIWKFPVKIQPQILAEMRASQTDFYHVKNSKELEIALQRLG